MKDSLYENSNFNLLISDILIAFTKTFNLKKITSINLSDFQNLNNYITEKSISLFDFLHNSYYENYDLIQLYLPWSVKKRSYNSKMPIKYKKNVEYNAINKSLEFLNPNGFGFYILPSSFIHSNSKNKLLSDLTENGYSLSIIINLPKNSLMPYTNIQPILIGIRKKQQEKIFVVEIDKTSKIDEIVDNYKNNKSNNNIYKGNFVLLDEFLSFENYKLQNEIQRINHGYKNYKLYNIQEIITSEIVSEENFQINNKNSIWFEKIISQKILTYLGTNIEKNELLQNKNNKKFIQYIINDKIVSTNYLDIFFHSELGSLLLKQFQNFYKHGNMKSFLIPIPDIETQNIITKSITKINSLKTEINKLEAEISMNPQNTKQFLEIIENSLLSMNKLSEEERILRIIRKGETKEIEFKQTFNIDIKSNKKEKFIQFSALKNIVAFLNTEGGVLIVGVKDENSQIVGIENDNFENDDKYLLNIRNLINRYIGIEYSEWINWNIVNIFNKKVLIIDCKKSSKPCFLKKSDSVEEFYIRSNPAADQLVGQKLLDYIKTHFKD